jgi:hypothetical protein
MCEPAEYPESVNQQERWTADLPVRAAPVYQAPVAVAPTWTGLYVGANTGWGSSGSNYQYTNGRAGVPLGDTQHGLTYARACEETPPRL